MSARIWKATFASLATLALLLVFALPGEAQIPGQQQAAPEDVAEEELVTFAEIYLEADEVREELEEQMATAQSPEEAQQLQAQANQMMVGIVEDHGMTVERYTEITQALNTDPELYQEFQEIVQELRGTPGVR